ncbi:hypothetical protein N7492_002646 [Penicillium capsulatum]|uniref:Uncharacterized protein n=1 Tax=Penicillium capsulatum TaxID=69766 RepID=A0A9W9LFF8_9EURO|nr:hypothetical protein N7492_009776 [Penicillium capsulatum]KAJ5152543.1 hypothetical protein N7492_009823 [Penicillium capsulatum]KAJ5162246.1 hypothetical protein N7492_007638 [Penicillium capsulatum]KAJ5173281.1 hypothetical protein N7492_005874 [Penicillium capsulatum]KAJ5179436.1 hypothetical protein N7492_002646 [Penicillium capsulatum]
MSLQYDDFGTDTAIGSASSTGVILRSPAQWRTWISQIRQAAEIQSVWKYIDPTISDIDAVIPPKEPREPVPRDFEDVDAVEDLSDEADRRYLRRLQHYDREVIKYTAITRGIARIAALIRNTLATEHQYQMADNPELRQLLRALQEKFSPRQRERMLEVRRQWIRHNRTPVKDSNIEVWITRWEALYAESISAEVPEAKSADCAIHDFLTAIQGLDETFCRIWYRDIFQSEDQNKKVSPTSVVNAFRQQRATQMPKKSKTPIIGMATLHGYPEAGQANNNKKKMPPPPPCTRISNAKSRIMSRSFKGNPERG